MKSDADGAGEAETGFLHIIDMVGQYLEHDKEEGVTRVEVCPDVIAQLSRFPVVSSTKGIAGKRQETRQTGADTVNQLEQIALQIQACKKCSLHRTRTHTVPGQGCAHPEIVFVGEAPGFDEDLQGLSFVGAAGQLLTKMISAMGLTREEVFIGNVLKCRPPENRIPLPDEMATCMLYLQAQLTALKPRVIITLGATAARGLLGVETIISKLRGNWMLFDGIDVMPTFHPAYLLRNPAAKTMVWEDLKEALRRIGRTPPPR